MTGIPEIMFELLSFELGEKLPEETKQKISPGILPDLYRLSKSHDISHLICDALDKNGFLEEKSEIWSRFLRERDLAVYRYTRLQTDLDEVSNALKEAKIMFAPLKGAVLRHYYPEPWMRTSCDLDILIREADAKKATDVILKKLSYKHISSSTHDMCLVTPAGMHLELHYALIEEEGRKKSSRVSDVCEGIINHIFSEEDGNFCKKMTDEEFWFYHIAHMAKHFVHGGCGIRPFIDIRIMEKTLSIDRKKLENLLNSGDLLKFGTQAEKLADIWFGGKTHDESTLRLEKYILCGGVYGNQKNMILVKKTKPGKMKYFIDKFFPRFQYMKAQFPVLKQHKWLLPFCYVARWFQSLPRAKSIAHNISSQKTTYKATTQQQQAEVDTLLDELGLPKC